MILRLSKKIWPELNNLWLTCLAAATGRRSAALNALAGAAIVVLAWRPAEAFSAGAQLSFLSTAVLVGVAAALPRAVVPTDPIHRLIDRSRSSVERWSRRRARNPHPINDGA